MKPLQLNKVIMILLLGLFLADYSLTAETAANVRAVNVPGSSYSLSVGEEDQQRLFFLNEAINPTSISFLKQHIKKGDRVLELGCGIGLMSQEVARIVDKSGHVLATDVSKKQIEIAKGTASSSGLPWLHFRTCSADNISSINEKFDAVYMRFLLIHLTNPMQIIKEAQTILKPGGIIISEELLGNNTIAAQPADPRLEFVKKIDLLQEELQKTDFSIASRLKKELPDRGFELVAYNEAHPVLDTMNKRRNFSLGMLSLKPALLAKQKINERKLDHMIDEVQRMEDNLSTKLFFYKVGQLAVRLKQPGRL